MSALHITQPVLPLDLSVLQQPLGFLSATHLTKAGVPMPLASLSSVRFLCPIPEHSGTKLGALIPVPVWFSASAFQFIPVPDAFRIQRNFMTEETADSETDFQHPDRLLSE
jgi:hypothetical protein